MLNAFMGVTEIAVIGPAGTGHKDVAAIEGVLPVAVFVEAGGEFPYAEGP